MLFSELSSLATWETEVRRERQKLGIEKAKAKGVYEGRKPKLTPAKVADLKQRHADGAPLSVLGGTSRSARRPCAGRASRQIASPRQLKSMNYLHLGRRQNGGFAARCGHLSAQAWRNARRPRKTGAAFQQWWPLRYRLGLVMQASPHDGEG
jgi:hypothetical protein